MTPIHLQSPGPLLTCNGNGVVPSLIISEKFLGKVFITERVQLLVFGNSLWGPSIRIQITVNSQFLCKMSLVTFCVLYKSSVRFFSRTELINSVLKSCLKKIQAKLDCIKFYILS